MNLRAFHLIDTMVALFVMLVSVSGVSAMEVQSQRSLTDANEHQAARWALSHTFHLPVSLLSEDGVAHYDFRGLPVAEPDKFLVRFTRKQLPGLVQWWFTVTWTDRNGDPRELTTDRLQGWAP